MTCSGARRAVALTLLLVAGSCVLAQPVLDLDAPRLSVCFPVSNGTRVDVHATIGVQWTSFNLFPPSSVSLWLVENDVVVKRIVAATPNDGEYAWSLPSLNYAGNFTRDAVYRVRVESVEIPSVFNVSGEFQVEFSEFQTLDPYAGFPERVMRNFGSIYDDEGTPINSYWAGQRQGFLFLREQLDASLSGSLLIRSVSVKVRELPALDVPDFRITYTTVPLSRGEFFASDHEGFVTNGVYRDATETVYSSPLIPVSSMAVDEWLQFNLSTAIAVPEDRHLFLEFSSNGRPGASLVKQGGLHMVETGTFQSVRYLSDDWNEEYPYPVDAAGVEGPKRDLYTVRARFDAVQTDAAASDCGAPPETQQTDDLPRWQRFSGSENPLLDCIENDDVSRPSCRFGSTLTAFGDNLLLFGGESSGFGGSSTFFNDLWMFNVRTAEWTLLHASDCTSRSQPACRSGHVAALIHDDMLAIYGGKDSDGVLFFGSSKDNSPRAILATLNLTDVTVAMGSLESNEFAVAELWTGIMTDSLTPSLGPRGAVFAAGASDMQGVLFVYGGETWSAAGESIVSDQLLRIDVAKLVELDGVVAAMKNASLLGGAERVLPVNVSAFLNQSIASWTAVQEMLPGTAGLESAPWAYGSCSDESHCVAGASMTFVPMTSEVVVIGGLLSDGGVSNGVVQVATNASRVLRLDEDCDDVISLSCRAFHSAVLLEDGRSIAIMGGSSASAVGNDMWRYDVVGRFWSRFSIVTESLIEFCVVDSELPLCREKHNVVRVGDTLIVFGGQLRNEAGLLALNNVWALRGLPVLIAPESQAVIPTQGGVTLTVAGRNFGEDTTKLKVNLFSPAQGEDALECTVVSATRDEVQCEVPSTGAGAGVFAQVIVSSVTEWRSFNNVTLFDFARPSVQSVVRADGSTEGGDRLTVIGEHFGPLADSAVFVGATACAGTELVDEARVQTHRVCVTPAGIGSGLVVSVVTAAQASVETNVVFSYNVPQLKNVSYGNAATTGGAQVTVFGWNLGASAEASDVVVLIGGVPAASTVWQSAEADPVLGQPNRALARLVATAGPGAGQGLAVTARVGGQDSVPVAGLEFSYNTPVITNILFVPGPTSGGSVVTVFGYDFGSSTSVGVQVGGAECADLQFLGELPAAFLASNPDDVFANATMRREGAVVEWMTCSAPAGLGTEAAVTVDVAGSRSSTGPVRVVYEPPVLDKVQPDVISTGEETAIFLDGRNFGADASQVSIDAGDLSCRPNTLVLLTAHERLTCVLTSPDDKGTLELSVTVAGQKSNTYSVRVRLQPVSESLTFAFSIVTSLFVAVTVLLWVRTWQKRDHKAIRAASMLFSSVIFVGAITTMSAVYFLHEREDPGCSTALWLVSVGFTLLYGTLVVKNFRILRLFNEQSVSNSGLISDSKLAGVVLGMVVLDVAILLPFTYSNDCGVPETSIAQALAALLVLYKLGLLLSGVVIAWKSRVIHIHEFQERQQVGYAIFGVSISILLVLPVVLLFRDRFEQQYVIRSGAVLFITFVTMCVLIVPKLYQIHRHEVYGEDPATAVSFGQSTRTLTGLSQRSSPLTRDMSWRKNRTSSRNVLARNSSGLSASSGSPSAGPVAAPAARRQWSRLSKDSDVIKEEEEEERRRQSSAAAAAGADADDYDIPLGMSADDVRLENMS